MVHSLIIADLNCRVLYSSIFNFMEDSSSRDELLSKIVRQVKNEFDFNSTVSCSANIDVAENMVSDFETKGILSINIADCWKPTIWHSYCGCLYILVCENSDNRILAARTLVLLIRTFRDILPKITNYISEFVVRADVVSSIVNTFMPSGQLLFLHNQAMQQVTKDLQKSVR